MAPKDSATQKRLAAALRENLKRRKAAQRTRGPGKPAADAKLAQSRPNKVQNPD
ncbi:MAG: hypothetical protein ACTHLR_11640 [Rhizomicrobium sp.]